MKRSWQYLLSALLTILFLFLAFRGMDPGKLMESMARANYAWMVVYLLCLLASHVLRSLRWRYFLDPVKPRIGLRPLFSAVMVGYLMNNVLPRAGELARPYVLARREGFPVSAAFGTIVVERVIDILTFIVLLAIVPLVYSGPLAESFPWLIPSGIVVSCLMIVGLGVLVTMMIRRDFTDGCLRVLSRILPEKLAARTGGMVHSFLDGVKFVTRPRNYLAIVALSVAVWFLYALMTYAAFFAFDIGGLGFGAAIVVLTISSIGVAIPTPGSVGSYHVLTAQTLTRLFGIDAVTALSYATVSHAVGFIAVSVIGAFFVWRDHLAIADTLHLQKGEEGQ